MVKADYVTPEEHINFLVIEYFNDNTALYIINENLNENDLEFLEKTKSKLLNALIRLPNINRATGGKLNQICSIIGEIKKEDIHLYNKENENDLYKLTLNANLYNELQENGILNLQDFATQYNAPSIILSERIIRANEKAKSIIESCEQKINDILENKSIKEEQEIIKAEKLKLKEEQEIIKSEKLRNKVESEKVEAERLNLVELKNNKIEVPHHDDCYIKDGMIIFHNTAADFIRILIKKTDEKQGRFYTMVDSLGEKVYLSRTKKKLSESKIKDKYSRYFEEVKDDELKLDEEFVNIVELCIDKILQ